jgi:hypothetical protein
MARAPNAATPPEGDATKIAGLDTDTSNGTSVHHPARWSSAILEAIAPVIDGWRLPVHDPFAGTGERLGALCDRLGLTFTGTELEAPFIVDPRVKQGDSTSILAYPRQEHCAVTSPVYANGYCDHFRWKPHHKWTWNTYRHARARIVGHDQPLHENNMGRWGLRGGRKALARHFDIADRAVDHWPIRAVVNVSDFFAGDDIYPYVQRWRKLLDHHGYVIVDEIPVATPRNGFGANGHRRVDHEMVLVALRREVAA